MIERSGKFLPREDTDAAHILQEQLKKDGINVHLNSSIASFELVSQKNGEFP
jgi:pyruvate/2-oxoglutarate dehydrogenase complex dihydrolipoamide dehydrogenase (E3) component